MALLAPRLQSVGVVMSTLAAMWWPQSAQGHRPTLVAADSVRVTEPEISAAYYDVLSGRSRSFLVDTPANWALYLNILVPRDANGNGRYNADVIDRHTGIVVDSLRSSDGPWREYWEQYGADWYVRGPELRRTLPAGSYLIRVSGPRNVGPYILAIGERESFGIREIVQSCLTIPTIKRRVFDANAVSFIRSPFGIAYLVVGVALGVFIAFIYRQVLRLLRRTARRAPFTAAENIGTRDRVQRAIIGFACVLVAVYTTWNVLLFLAAGFSFYQAVSSWCAWNSVIGRDSCPV